ncbi:cobalamin-dependent methionine synthase I [Evansella vedderi]|uniref:Cobalamin-dependent methionine synthase I n=1 Tax=Evansella vedderi TaxID=38282 RepID=A0ABT9ZSN5_9BACI|nr:YpjP family protein [Evansella vedderi]MDQ0253493.1 cobalamin-dependent methionine synthase I [Evansella vedderi]
MKLWFKKVSVILITFMTLGVFIPPNYLDTRAENEDVVSSSREYADNQSSENTHNNEIDYSNEYEDNDDTTSSADYLVNMLTAQAKEQTLYKLGPRIIDRVEDELTTTILPNIEEVLQMIFEEAGEDEFQYYGITEQPANGYGEKIFVLYDHRTKEEIARFDVRRDNRPKDGHWFNFHYHLSKDNFEEHYNIGDVYWDKNTPPKWMA